MAKPRNRWGAALLLSAAAVALLTVLLVGASLLLPPPASGVMYAACMWGVVPLCGALAAFCATRRGLSNYVAWAVPPVCQSAAHWLMLGYPPASAGMPLVAAALALVAAAAAQVLNERAEGAARDNSKRERRNTK